MIKPTFQYIATAILLLSCSAEKMNLSPLANSGNEPMVEYRSFGYGERKNLTLYSSEITNLIATFPKFRNDAVNAEVAQLKYHLKDYIGAMHSYNINGLDVAQRNFERSYKKLQKLRKYLKPEDDQVLNRYLVRIKTNMTFLDSSIVKDSLQAAPNN